MEMSIPCQLTNCTVTELMDLVSGSEIQRDLRILSSQLSMVMNRSSVTLKAFALMLGEKCSSAMLKCTAPGNERMWLSMAQPPLSHSRVDSFTELHVRGSISW